jgi:hypothetical protein
VPDPQVSWGDLQDLLHQLEGGPLPLELQLPAAR